MSNYFDPADAAERWYNDRELDNEERQELEAWRTLFAEWGDLPHKAHGAVSLRIEEADGEAENYYGQLYEILLEVNGTLEEVDRERSLNDAYRSMKSSLNRIHKLADVDEEADNGV